MSDDQDGCEGVNVSSGTGLPGVGYACMTCSHKPGGRLSLLSARPAVTFATLKKAATSFAAL